MVVTGLEENLGRFGVERNGPIECPPGLGTALLGQVVADPVVERMGMRECCPGLGKVRIELDGGLKVLNNLATSRFVEVGRVLALVSPQKGLVGLKILGRSGGEFLALGLE